MYSVGILSYNHPNLTARCLNSFAIKSLEVGNGQNEEIYLLHNGSRAQNVDVLKANFSSIRHLELHENQGFSGGANFLINSIFSLSRHDWLLFVTNDCRLIEMSTAPQSPGLYAPLIYRRNTELIDSIGAVFKPLTGKLSHLRSLSQAQQALHLRAKMTRTFRQKYFYIPGTAFWVHRSAWLALGGFDTSLHTYWEDVDLSIRAQNIGIQLGLAPQTQLRHGIGKTCHKDQFYTQHLFQRNRRIISRRYANFLERPLQRLWL